MSNFIIKSVVNETTLATRTKDGFTNLSQLTDSFNAVNGTNKSLKNWKETQGTKDYIEAVERYLEDVDNQTVANSGKNRYLENTDNQEVKKPIAIKNARGHNGGTWAHDLVTVEYCGYLSPDFKVAAWAQLLGIKPRMEKRINAAERTKEINSRICKLQGTEFSPTKETLIKATNRLINRLAFGEHRDGIRDEKTTDEDLIKLDNAFNVITDALDKCHNSIDDYVAICKTL